jgi:hypothetical protein
LQQHDPHFGINFTSESTSELPENVRALYRYDGKPLKISLRVDESSELEIRLRVLVTYLFLHSLYSFEVSEQNGQPS